MISLVFYSASAFFLFSPDNSSFGNRICRSRANSATSSANGIGEMVRSRFLGEGSDSGSRSIMEEIDCFVEPLVLGIADTDAGTETGAGGCSSEGVRRAPGGGNGLLSDDSVLTTEWTALSSSEPVEYSISCGYPSGSVGAESIRLSSVDARWPLATGGSGAAGS